MVVATRCACLDCGRPLRDGERIGLAAYGLEGDFCHDCVMAFFEAQRRAERASQEQIKRERAEVAPQPETDWRDLSAEVILARFGGWYEQKMITKRGKEYGPYKYLRWRVGNTKKSRYIGKVA